MLCQLILHFRMSTNNMKILGLIVAESIKCSEQTIRAKNLLSPTIRIGPVIGLQIQILNDRDL